MMHAILYIIFLTVVTHWLAFEFPKKHEPLTRYMNWATGAILFALIGSGISNMVGGRTGNFLLHAIGGGTASFCMYLYLSKTFRFAPNWRLALVALFLFTSTLGVLNELGEYAIELTSSLIMSVDSQDTWRDFVANTSGAVIPWVLYQLSWRKHTSEKL